jgi:predicted nucleic acid-binding protein
MDAFMSFALVDTDILIDLSAGVSQAVDTLKALDAEFTVAVSTITIMELIAGCRNKTELRNTEKLIERFEVCPLNEHVSTMAVGLVKKYRLSHGLLLPDAFIAATALANDIPLASKNQRDYRFISGLNLLPYPYK